MTWRAVLGFGQEDELDFSSAHNRYRERMLSLDPLSDLEHISRLNAAIEAARLELATVDGATT